MNGNTEMPSLPWKDVDPNNSYPKIREPRTKIVEGELTCQLVSPGSPVICMRYAVRLGRG